VSSLKKYIKIYINPLNANINLICHLLALLGAHRILHFSRIRVKICGPVSVVGIATGYGLGGPGNESRGGGCYIFRTCPDRPWDPPSLLYNGYLFFPGPGVKSGRGMTLTPHPLLEPWSRKSRAITLLPLWAVRPVQSLSACTRVHFVH